MGHHAEHAARLVDDARDIALGAVRARFGRNRARRIRIPECNAPFAFEPVERLAIRKIVALAVRDRNLDGLAFAIALGEERLIVLDLQEHVAADEVERRVAHQRAGKQSGLAQDLKAIADADDRRSCVRLGDHVLHDRRVRGHRPAAQVVAIREAARQHDHIGRGDARITMPDHLRRETGDPLDRRFDVAIAVRTRKDDDGSTEHGGL